MKTPFLLCLVFLISCQQKKTTVSPQNKKELEKVITDLKTDQAKNRFLSNLWYDDQAIRGGQDGEIIARYGYNSKEHKEHVRKFIEKNDEIFMKMKLYLEIHGYPSNIEVYDELAVNAFPIIIGHHHHYNDQKELLPFLYNAYKRNECSLEDVVWVLGEMHESKHRGRRYEMKSNRFTTEQEFLELQDALNLNLSLK